MEKNTGKSGKFVSPKMWEPWTHLSCMFWWHNAPDTSLKISYEILIAGVAAKTYPLPNYTYPNNLDASPFKNY